MTLDERIEAAAAKRGERFRKRRERNPNEFRPQTIQLIAGELCSKACYGAPGKRWPDELPGWIAIVQAWFDENLPVLPVDLLEESVATDRAHRELAIAHGLPVNDICPYGPSPEPVASAAGGPHQPGSRREP